MRFLQPQLDVSREPVAGPVNWWEEGGATGAVAVYQPKGAASLAASYTDLSGNGNDAAPGVAPTWDATNGWIFAGGQNLSSGVTIQSGYSTIIRFSNVSVANNYLISQNDANGKMELIGNMAILNILYRYGDSSAQTSPGIASGVLAIAGPTGYKNGSFDANIGGSWGTASATLSIGARSTGGNNLIGNVQAVAIYNNTLTAPQVAAITSAMQEL